jgi:hypothetical protein
VTWNSRLHLMEFLLRFGLVCLESLSAFKRSYGALWSRAHASSVPAHPGSCHLAQESLRRRAFSETGWEVSVQLFFLLGTFAAPPLSEVLVWSLLVL